MKPIRPILRACTAATLTFAAMSATACQVTDAKYKTYFGKPSDTATAQREIVIKPETRNVSVSPGQVVRFTVAPGTSGSEASFAWNFDTWGGRVARLDRLAPEGMTIKPINVYIADDPRYGG